MEQPTSAQIEELRSSFLKKLEEEGDSVPGGFHPLDLARVKKSDDWLSRFLVHHDLNVKDALGMLWDTCEWRKTYGTNDINENNIKLDYVMDGSMFGYGRDKDGKTMFVLKCAKHVRGQRDLDELKRCIVYWFERLERQTKGDMITIFFDTANTGLSNMDMDFMKYLISLFKLYYPNFLNYILIFEMPWVLNAAFKVIKSWLPSKAVAKIRFINKTTIKDVVDPETTLKCWGGTDEFTYNFTPEIRTADDYSTNPETRSAAAEVVKHKVHFADGSPTSDSGTIDGSRLRVVPRTVTFVYKDGVATASITLTNADNVLVTYKIKTTSPDSYNVRPTSGLLKPQDSVVVTIVLNADFNHHKDSISKDKFLVMARVPDKPLKSAQEIVEFWKSGKAKEQHRLHCVLSTVEGGSLHNGSAGTSLAASKDPLQQITSAVMTLLERSERMEIETRRTRVLLYFVLALVVVLFAMLAVLGHQQHQARQDAFQNQECSSTLL